jgi:hypothetical protein
MVHLNMAFLEIDNREDHFSQRLAECIISLRAEIWVHRHSLTMPLGLFIEVPVPNNSISGVD